MAEPGGFTMLRCIILASLVLCPCGLRADEGMWTFDNLPLKQMTAQYGFAPDQAWLDHLRLSTVALGDQGSGAFVGHDGLVLTNHHVTHPSIQRLSDPRHDLVKQGFVAMNRAQEIRMPGLEIRVLEAMKDITCEVEQTAQSGRSTQEANAARQRAMEVIQRRETAESGLTWELVDLQPRGETWIYGYRTFRDVRLVMAPEYDIAAFGKEWDNFTYPRHDLDFSLVRVYENDRPYRSAHTLTWTRKGIPKGGLTLVAGHPGRTNRLETRAQMDFRRRVVNPLTVQTLERTLSTLAAYAARNEENARSVSADLLETANFLKVYRTEIQGLEDPEIVRRIQAGERELRSWVDRDPKWREQVGPCWKALPQLFLRQETLAREYQLMHRIYASLERGPLQRALRLVRVITAAEPRREGDFRDEPYSMNRELETLLLAAGLAQTREWLGDRNPLVKALLNGASPEKVASRALQDTRIDDPAFVQGLIEGGPQALGQCQDPLLLLALKLDPRSREVQRQYDALEAQVGACNARIAKARFALRGQSAYPEADFTLRFSYGAVQPYPAEGTLQPPFTTFGGLFDRADAWGPTAEAGSWALPRRWLQRRKAVDPSVPLNFITTNDITGGSSGSPIVDQSGELVGLVFDGNIQSIPGRFHYDDRQNRCIAVDARAILEALAKVYDADHLVQELTEP
jgi:hypothetical protein